jgi:diaminohydroxyphosphoribosylaminopyrimidine deaminase/5-amino-6-(5-phosphoribosylamino)uracil reductase
MTRGRPWLRLKLAASLDGKTALSNGSSRWITGPEARRDGHRWRARACAVLTGIGTVRDDDPRLTVRDIETPRQPLRVVVDSRLEISPEARILGGGPVLIAAACEDAAKAAALAQRGAEVLVLPDARGKVDLGQLLAELARRGVGEAHAEAGFKLNGSLVREGLVDEFLIYLAPCLIGDAARGMFDLPELTELAGRRDLAIRDMRMVGTDLRILARPA